MRRYRSPQGLPADVQLAVAGPVHPRPSGGSRAHLPPRHRRPARARRGRAPASSTRSASCSAATPSGRSRSTGCTASSSTSSREDGIGARLHWMIHGVHHDHPERPAAPRDAAVGLRPAGAVLLRAVLGRARRRVLDAVRGRLPGRLPGLRHDPLPRPPSPAAHARSGGFLRESHMRHHFQDDERGFGVSAPYWDRVFGTHAAARARG